jgi:hypothetical protein
LEKLRIAVGISWFADPLIVRTLASIPDDWDILLIDGRYDYYDSSRKKSETELVRTVRNQSNVKYSAFSGPEHEKRNQYLKKARKYQYMLILDSDEYITEYDQQKFEDSLRWLNHGLHLVSFINKNGLPTQYGRLLVNPHQWRYKDSHKYITDGKETRPVSQADGIVTGITVRHDDTNRPELLKQDIEAYQKELWKHGG